MTKLSNSQSQVLTVSQAAKFLKVSIDTLRRWDRSGKLTTRRSPGGNRRYSKEDLRNFKKTGSSSNDTLLTVKEAAEKLQVSPLTIRRWDNEGKIKVTRDESNYRRISMSEIKRILGQEQGQQTEQVEKVEKVEKINREEITPLINRQIVKFSLYAFTAITLVIFVVGLQLTSTPWGKEFLSQNIYKVPQTLSEDVKKLSQVNQVKGDILGDESFPAANYQLQATSYSPNLLKNPSFETKGATSPTAFWQLHPNSTDSNTQMSNQTAHSGSYSLLLHDESCKRMTNDELKMTNENSSIQHSTFRIVSWE